MDEWQRDYLLHPDGGHKPVKREPEEGRCLDVVVIVFCAGVCGLALVLMGMASGFWTPLRGLLGR